MRILVFSLPRTCSSITMQVCSTVFGVTDLKEVFSNETHDGTPMLSGLVALHRRYQANHQPIPATLTLPTALLTEDDYCGKILTSHCVNRRFDYRGMDYQSIDRIIFTTRQSLIDVMASWMLLSAFQATGRRRITRQLHQEYQQFQAPVNLNMLPNIQDNIVCFHDLYAWFSSRYPERCLTLTYEMYQSSDIPALVTALRPEHPDLAAAQIRTVLQQHTSMHNHKCYATDVTNYDALLNWYRTHPIPVDHQIPSILY